MADVQSCLGADNYRRKLLLVGDLVELEEHGGGNLLRIIRRHNALDQCIKLRRMAEPGHYNWRGHLQVLYLRTVRASVRGGMRRLPHSSKKSSHHTPRPDIVLLTTLDLRINLVPNLDFHDDPLCAAFGAQNKKGTENISQYPWPEIETGLTSLNQDRYRSCLFN